MSEEEKTLEEQTETIIDAIETETEDDVREAFEINKEDGPAAALGAPLLRDGGDPDPADPNMIQKHLDNFLAALCGETPVDSNVRTSTEYWLKRIYDTLGDVKGIEKRTVLWTNPSPTSAFAVQDIAVNISEYDFIDVEFIAVTSTQDYTSHALLTVGTNTVMCWVSSSGVKTRDVGTEDPTKIAVGAGASSSWSGITSGLSADNSVCVPLRITGIKLTQ